MPNFMTNLSKFIKERQNSTKEYQSEKQREITSWLVLISCKKIIFSPSIFFSSFSIFIIFEILVLV
jgi:hypothetical protein